MTSIQEMFDVKEQLSKIKELKNIITNVILNIL